MLETSQEGVILKLNNEFDQKLVSRDNDDLRGREIRLKIVGSPVRQLTDPKDFKSEEIDKVSSITGILRKSYLDDAGALSPIDSSLMYTKLRREKS